MQHNDHENDPLKTPTDEPYSILGSGNLCASLYKRGTERGGWYYHFNLFRMDQSSGSADPRFRPSDVIDLAKLARLLAFAMAEDGCLQAGPRDDLYRLAARLDGVLPVDRHCQFRALEVDSSAAHALREMLDYLWEDEARHFRDGPAENHIYRNLVVLDRWLAGVGPARGATLQAFHFNGHGPRGAVCPICGGRDARVTLEHSTWMVCHAHEVRWQVDERPPSASGTPAADAGSKNWQRIGHYREVVPYRMPVGAPGSQA